MYECTSFKFGLINDFQTFNWELTLGIRNDETGRCDSLLRSLIYIVDSPCTVIWFGTTWFSNVGVVTLIIAHHKTWQKRFVNWIFSWSALLWFKKYVEWPVSILTLNQSSFLWLQSIYTRRLVGSPGIFINIHRVCPHS